MLMFILLKSNLNNLLNLDSDKTRLKPPALKDTQVKEGFYVGFSIFWLIMETRLALLFPLCGQRCFECMFCGDNTPFQIKKH